MASLGKSMLITDSFQFINTAALLENSLLSYGFGSQDYLIAGGTQKC